MAEHGRPRSVGRGVAAGEYVGEPDAGAAACLSLEAEEQGVGEGRGNLLLGGAGKGLREKGAEAFRAAFAEFENCR